MTIKTQILGWDIGGAHVKAALLDEAGRVRQVVQQPCPLWKGLDYLDRAIESTLAELPAGDYRHVATMTGELVDCFAGREEGVAAIVATLVKHVGRDKLSIFAGNEGLLAAGAVSPSHCMSIASSNWLASVTLATAKCEHGLFVDIGSTTTDILLIENRGVRIQGYTDYQRLVSGELLYTGIVRTAVMAVATQAEFNGATMGLMAEYFATMADVYRVTGDLDETHDQSETADGAEKTPLASARRLSRMTGYEFSAGDWPLWLAFAAQLKQRQKLMIRQACSRQIARASNAGALELIGAGVGRFLLRELAAEMNLHYRDFSDCIVAADDVCGLSAADCAPAVAVAYLAGEFG